MTDNNSSTKVCGRCGHVWVSVKEMPARCPSCGTYHWYGDSVTNTCAVCGHVWFSRTGKPPLRCPKCKTRSWSSADNRTKRTCTEYSDQRSKDIIELYDSGKGCVSIAMDTGTALSVVIDVVKSTIGENRLPRI